MKIGSIELNSIESYSLLLIVAFGVAYGLRFWLPSDRGLTVYLSHTTRYIPANVIGFWMSLALPIALIAIKLLTVLFKKVWGSSGVN